ncbi:uncharacterized protein LOC143018058 isoform X2 [Oratosquilla oratoria]|uniref:uncharacterized protein LOC143018058 isoform X2 n=1 Tax=Oratosquilla oratoria TaxID=337810 RepID=UPI003F77101B
MQDCRMMLACWAGFLLLVSFASSASSARLTPIGESDMVGLPERLRDLVLLRRLVYGPEVAAGPEPAESSVPIVRVDDTAYELDLLRRASDANIQFRDLKVSPGGVKMYCQMYAVDQQCRSCITMGDKSCSQGDIGNNGEDSDFINGGFNPGK